jgi:hypothetical protein
MVLLRFLECKSSDLVRKGSGLFGSSDFGRVFSSHRNGRYAVSWHYEGNRLGPVLHFSKS